MPKEMTTHPLMDLDQVRLAVIGLGYVGLPLAVAFGKRYTTLGFDIQQRRISELRDGHDRTNETSADQFAAATGLRLSSD